MATIQQSTAKRRSPVAEDFWSCVACQSLVTSAVGFLSVMIISLDIDTFASGGKSKAQPAASLNVHLHGLPWRRGENASASADRIAIHIPQELIRPYPTRRTPQRVRND